MNIVKYNHHEAEVSVMEHLKGKHRESCLCYANCKYFKPDQLDNCEIAQETFELCVKHNTVTPVFECPKFEKV